MADDLTIRRAERRDEETLLRLWKTFLDEQATFDRRFRPAEDAEERWRNDFPTLVKHERRRLFVAERGEELLGFITAQRSALPPIYELASEVFVEEIYVHPEGRGAQVGSGLLRAVTDWANEVGANRLRLGALAENAEGRTFWERQGARPFSVMYTIELSDGRREQEERSKGKLGF